MSLPGFYFYTGDWLKDTRCLTPEARGCWIDWLCMLWENGGTVTWPVAALGQFCGVTEAKAREVLDELSSVGVAFVEYQTGNKTVTKLSNRRMVRHFDKSKHIQAVRSAAGKASENKRATKGQQKGLSSSSSSSSSSLNLKEWAASAAPLGEEKAGSNGVVKDTRQADVKALLDFAAKLAGEDKVAARELCQWVGKMFKILRYEPHERVVAVAKASLLNLEKKLQNGYNVTTVWGLLNKIFDSERTRYMQGPEHEAHKKPINIPTSVADILRNIH